MITRIHVNQHIIRRNAKEQDASKHEPPLTVKDYQKNRKGTSAQILDRQGETVAEVVYSPDKPLPCGAKVWIETKHGVVVL